MRGLNVVNKISIFDFAVLLMLALSASVANLVKCLKAKSKRVCRLSDLIDHPL